MAKTTISFQDRDVLKKGWWKKNKKEKKPVTGIGSKHDALAKAIAGVDWLSLRNLANARGPGEVAEALPKAEKAAKGVPKVIKALDELQSKLDGLETVYAKEDVTPSKETLAAVGQLKRGIEEGYTDCKRTIPQLLNQAVSSTGDYVKRRDAMVEQISIWTRETEAAVSKAQKTSLPNAKKLLVGMSKLEATNNTKWATKSVQVIQEIRDQTQQALDKSENDTAQWRTGSSKMLGFISKDDKNTMIAPLTSRFMKARKELDKANRAIKQIAIDARDAFDQIVLAKAGYK